jgi:hypothetical protein
MVQSSSPDKAPGWVSYGGSSGGGQQPPRPQKRARSVLPLIFLAAIGLLAGVSALWWASQPEDTSPPQAYRQALALHEQGQLDSALALLREARSETQEARLVQQIDTLIARIQLERKVGSAERLTAEGQLEAAKEQLEQVLAENPDTPAAKKLLVFVQSSLERKRQETGAGTANTVSEAAMGRAATTRTMAATATTKATGARAATAAGSPSASPSAEAAEAPPEVADSSSSRRKQARLASVRKRRRRRRAPPRRPTSTIDGRDVEASSEPEQGKLRVEASVPAKVFIDNEDTGRVTPTLIELPVGTHTVEARGIEDSRRRKRVTAVIQAGNVSRVLVELPKPAAKPDESGSSGDRPKSAADESPAQPVAKPVLATGFVSVSARPAGTVYVDGVSTGRLTPLWMHKIKVGNHLIEVRAGDGTVRRRRVEVKAKQHVSVALR